MTYIHILIEVLLRFSHSVDGSVLKTEILWKYRRYRVIHSFYYLSALPPPANLFIHIVQAVVYLRQKWIKSEKLHNKMSGTDTSNSDELGVNDSKDNIGDSVTNLFDPKVDDVSHPSGSKSKKQNAGEGKSKPKDTAKMTTTDLFCKYKIE